MLNEKNDKNANKKNNLEKTLQKDIANNSKIYVTTTFKILYRDGNS